jgi:hypothetical protein
VTFGSDLYDAMQPLAQRDEELGNPLAAFCEAIGVPFEWVVTYALDSDTATGWSLLMSPWTCPAEGLAWLGQFVGVKLVPGSSEASQRQQIAAHLGFARGTPGAIRGAVGATLTGTKTVLFQERAGDPYALSVVTWTTETPDPALTLKALTGTVAAGIIVTYSTEAIWDYAVLGTSRATYTVVKGAWASYAAMLTGGP